MNEVNPKQPSLPEGWFFVTEEEAQTFHAELQLELPPGHLLFEKKVAIFARRRDCDDILVQHEAQPDRFTIVHLTWIRRRETNVKFPGVRFDGTFDEFARMTQT